MSKFPSKCVSITSRTCMSIGISSARENEDIRDIYSFFRLNLEFLFLSFRQRRNLLHLFLSFLRRQESSILLMSFRPKFICFCDEWSGEILLDGSRISRFRYCFTRNDRNLNHSLPIMKRYLITIFRKYMVEYFEDFTRIITHRKHSIICFDFEFEPMFLEPFIAFFRSKLPERFLYKIPSTSILGFEYFFISDPCSYITPPTP